MSIHTRLGATVPNRERPLIRDIDAPHLLRDVAREYRIAGQKNFARRLSELADDVQAIMPLPSPPAAASETAASGGDIQRER